MLRHSLLCGMLDRHRRSVSLTVLCASSLWLHMLYIQLVTARCSSHTGCKGVVDDYAIVISKSQPFRLSLQGAILHAPLPELLASCRRPPKQLCPHLVLISQMNRCGESAHVVKGTSAHGASWTQDMGIWLKLSKGMSSSGRKSKISLEPHTGF